MIEIRKAKLRDVENISKMRKDFMKTQLNIMKRSSPEHINDFDEKTNSQKIFKNFLKRQIFSKNGLVLIAECDKKIAGFAFFIIQKNIPLFKLDKYCEILDMYVKEEFIGKGISTRIKESALKWCKTKGISKIALRVLPNNSHAKGIYKKWGFSDFLIEMRMNI